MEGVARSYTLSLGQGFGIKPTMTKEYHQVLFRHKTQQHLIITPPGCDDHCGTGLLVLLRAIPQKLVGRHQKHRKLVS